MNKRNILIVDDDDDVISYVASLLEYKGYHVIAVRDGDLAIHKVFEHKPDLIILDALIRQIGNRHGQNNDQKIHGRAFKAVPASGEL